MTLGADMLTFREFTMNEPLPLSAIHQTVLEFLRGREDVVLCGAQAVNAYVLEPRMTQDIDLMAVDAPAMAQALKQHLHHRFQIAVRIREIGEGKGYRLYQVQQGGNRHLVDVRPVASLPLAQRIGQVLVIAPAELIASKVISYHQRRGKPKAGTDWRDLAMLLLAFPELKHETSLVVDCLRVAGADAKILAVWQELVETEIEPEADDDEFWVTSD